MKLAADGRGCVFLFLWMGDRDDVLPSIFEAGAELSASSRDIVAAFGADAIAHAVLREYGAEGLNSLRTGGAIVGGGRVDGDAVHVGELFEGCEQSR